MATSRSSSSERSGVSGMTMSSTFRRAPCFADGQLTPPSSPDHPRQPAARHVPRVQLPKFLQRPKSSKSNNLCAISRPTPIRTLQMPACVSEIKLPSPLLYPESPVDTEYSYSSTVSAPSAPELRRISESYHDLRSVAAHQPSTRLSYISTPLLPSPITYDLKEPMESYFRFHNPRLIKAANDYKSYEDLHILSCYYDDSKTASLQDIEHQLEDGPGHRFEGLLAAKDDKNSLSTETDDDPVTPRDQVRRGTCCSDESDWLASTRSHSERLRRFKARCYQVVQHPVSSDKDRKNEDQIMLATVLVGPGKPKLVQISRPSSKSSSTRNDSGIRPQPHTPGAARAEISAFSPYDTPGPNLPSTDSIGQTLPASDPSYSTTSLVPAPLTLTSRSHSITTTATSSTAFSATMPHIDSLSDPFGQCQSQSATSTYTSSQPPTRSSSLRPPQHSYLLQPNTSRTPSPHPSPTTTPANYTYNARLSRTLASITSVINSFPSNILHLSSTPILSLRSHSSPADSIYISTFAKIFPSAQPSLLSALAAWLLVDIYFSRVIAAHHHHSGPTNINPSNAVLSQPHYTPSPLNSYDHLLAAAARSNDSLHRIPTKARDLLGIGRVDPVLERMNEKAITAQLVRRTITVSHSVAVVSQKLIEALRGTWDEDIWRALRCLVEVIEGCRNDIGPGIGEARMSRGGCYDEEIGVSRRRQRAGWV